MLCKATEADLEQMVAFRRKTCKYWSEHLCDFLYGYRFLIDEAQPVSSSGTAHPDVVLARTSADESQFCQIWSGASVGTPGHADGNVFVP